MALTDEQIREENKFLEGLPRFNVAAFLLPPIWGPAHGIWATILFYPIWLFADNAFYAAYEHPSVLSIGLAIIVFASLLAGTVAFAIVGQPLAAHGAVMIALATYYNLVIRPTLGA